MCSCKCFTWFFKFFFFYAYVGFVIALGVFQGMGVGPSFITLANWYPKKSGEFIQLFGISRTI